MIFMCNNRYKAIRIQLEHESIAGNIHIRVTKSNFSLLLNFNETTLMEQLCIRFVLFVFLIVGYSTCYSLISCFIVREHVRGIKKNPRKFFQTRANFFKC